MPSAASGSPAGRELGGERGGDGAVLSHCCTCNLKADLGAADARLPTLPPHGDTSSSPRTWRSRQYRWHYHPVQAGKYLPQNRVVGARNSHFILKASRPRRWWTCAPKEPVWPWVRIQASFCFFPGFFYTKRVRCKVKHFLFPICVISSCLQLCTGGPDQALRWVHQRYFSLKLIA